MNSRIVVFFILVLSTTQHITAQNNDAQLWENITIEEKITQRFAARLVQESRVTENFNSFTFNYFDLGVNYKINKHIHSTLAYVWVEKRQLSDLWSTRHQVYVDLTFRKKLQQFLVTDRQMFLWQVKDYYSSRDGHIADNYLRNKITIRYTNYFKVSPYIAEEIYYRIYGPYDNLQSHFKRLRTFAGVFFRNDLINEFEAYYLLEYNFKSANPSKKWVIGIGYTHSFQ